MCKERLKRITKNNIRRSIMALIAAWLKENFFYDHGFVPKYDLEKA